MFDFSKYKGTGMYLVAETYEENKTLRQFMHEAGFRWGSGDSLLELNYFMKSNEEIGTCIAYLIDKYGKVSYEMPSILNPKLNSEPYVMFKNIPYTDLSSAIDMSDFIALLGGENNV